GLVGPGQRVAAHEIADADGCARHVGAVVIDRGVRTGDVDGCAALRVAGGRTGRLRSNLDVVEIEVLAALVKRVRRRLEPHNCVGARERRDVVRFGPAGAGTHIKRVDRGPSRTSVSGQLDIDLVPARVDVGARPVVKGKTVQRIGRLAGQVDRALHPRARFAEVELASGDDYVAGA